MTTRAITPVGPWGMYLAGIAWLVANSPTFQAIVEAESADDALQRFIHLEADDTRDTTHTYPRAVVMTDLECSLTLLSGAEYADSSGCLLTLQLPPSPAVVDLPFDAELEFINRVEAILADIRELQGTGTGYTDGQTHIVVGSAGLVSGIFRKTETGEVLGQEQTLDWFECMIQLRSVGAR